MNLNQQGLPCPVLIHGNPKDNNMMTSMSGMGSNLISYFCMIPFLTNKKDGDQLIHTQINTHTKCIFYLNFPAFLSLLTKEINRWAGEVSVKDCQVPLTPPLSVRPLQTHIWPTVVREEL